MKIMNENNNRDGSLTMAIGPGDASVNVCALDGTLLTMAGALVETMQVHM